MDMATRVRENRVRRLAERQGLRLLKVRRKDHAAWDYGLYELVDERSGLMVVPEANTGRMLETVAFEGKLTRAQVEAYLSGDPLPPAALRHADALLPGQDAP